jgi:hypothetical protein
MATPDPDPNVVLLMSQMATVMASQAADEAVIAGLQQTVAAQAAALTQLGTAATNQAASIKALNTQAVAFGSDLSDLQAAGAADVARGDAFVVHVKQRVEADLLRLFHACGLVPPMRDPDQFSNGNGDAQTAPAAPFAVGVPVVLEGPAVERRRGW